MSEHTLPQLPYAYNALEPAISEEIMTIHHTKHHQLYVTNLNNAIKAYNSAISSNDVRKQIELQSAIKFNGGGHINHSLFWKNLAPANQGGGSLHDGPLKQAIERDFGSLDNLKASFNATIATIQGSGWGWLGFNPKNSKLEVVTTKDQDPLISHHPIIGVDAWEHAFYLQYKNVKAGTLHLTPIHRRVESCLYTDFFPPVVLLYRLLQEHLVGHQLQGGRGALQGCPDRRQGPCLSASTSKLVFSVMPASE